MLTSFRSKNITKRLSASLVIALAIGLARLGSLKHLRAKYNTSRTTKGSLKRPFLMGKTVRTSFRYFRHSSSGAVFCQDLFLVWSETIIEKKEHA